QAIRCPDHAAGHLQGPVRVGWLRALRGPRQVRHQEVDGRTAGGHRAALRRQRQDRQRLTPATLVTPASGIRPGTKNGYMSPVPPPEPSDRQDPPPPTSRRRFLGGAGLAAAGVAVGAAGGLALGLSRDTAAQPAVASPGGSTTTGTATSRAAPPPGGPTDSGSADSGSADSVRAAAVVPFYGEHQAGVTTA